MHGFIFGGWLMRRAFESAYACGWKATGSPPRFLCLSDIVFHTPVPVGRLVRFDAQVWGCQRQAAPSAAGTRVDGQRRVLRPLSKIWPLPSPTHDDTSA